MSMSRLMACPTIRGNLEEPIAVWKHVAKSLKERPVCFDTTPVCCRHGAIQSFFLLSVVLFVFLPSYKQCGSSFWSITIGPYACSRIFPTTQTPTITLGGRPLRPRCFPAPPLGHAKHTPPNKRTRTLDDTQLHFRTDAPIELKALFFFPSYHTEKFGMARLEPGVSLYSRKASQRQRQRHVWLASIMVLRGTGGGGVYSQPCMAWSLDR